MWETSPGFSVPAARRRFEDKLGGRTPQDSLFRVLFTTAEADEALARSGGMEDAGPAFGFQRGQ